MPFLNSLEMTMGMKETSPKTIGISLNTSDKAKHIKVVIKINYPQSKEILFLRGDINYTEFHLADGKKIVSSSTLLKHQEKLISFIQVSKSHFVNPVFVKKMEHEGAYAQIELLNGNHLKVSRRRIDYVKNSISIIK